jgi:spore germination cell wall hydrolase CwlJ-like protein
MVAVGEVIRNRMRRRYSSDGTVAGTVLRPYQFSGWNTQDPNRIPAVKLDDDSDAVQDCIKAWEQSEATDFAGGAVLYLNPDAVEGFPDWVSKSNLIRVIGRHHFYNPRKR